MEEPHKTVSALETDGKGTREFSRDRETSGTSTNKEIPGWKQEMGKEQAKRTTEVSHGISISQ